MAARASSKVKTFTIAFPDTPELNEGLHARRVANFLGTDHNEIPVVGLDACLLDTLVSQLDEPIADTSIIPTAMLSAAVRQHVTVALGGDGADELFGGYPQYSHLATINAWRTRRLPALRRQMGNIVSGYSQSIPGGNAVRSIFDDPGSIGSFNMYFNEQCQRALAPAHFTQHNWIDERTRNFKFNNNQSAGERASRVDFESYLPDEVLVKVDRSSCCMHWKLVPHSSIIALSSLPLVRSLGNSRLKEQTKKFYCIV